MTPADASLALRQGKVLDVHLDTAVQALALAVPYLFRHIDPTQTNGSGGLAKFRKLCDNAGLPGDHPMIAAWLTLRALRPQAGDALLIEIDCPVTKAIATALGTVSVATEARTLRDDRTNPDAISITGDLPAATETGVVVTPAGVIRVPGSSVTSTAGTWASALISIDKLAISLGRKGYDADPDAVVELDWVRPTKGGAVDADSIHEDWSPEIAYHGDLKPHPARLIQSATLATVNARAATYRPRLPRRVIASGFISDAQFDFIVAAGEAHSRHLPYDPANGTQVAHRTGIFLADGTGAGKTNEVLGVVLDNVLRGRKRAIIVLAKRRHRHGFIEAWARMGRDKRDIIFQWDKKPNADIRSASGILLTTYGTLRDQNVVDESYPRIDQLRRWVGDDFDGVIAFDEAQEMRNAAGSEDQTGRSVTSAQGVAAVALQNAFPDARVIYASATGATDVHNLAYATRLGLWGPGTCFASRLEFIKLFEAGGIADLEQVTLSLKAAGVYMARSLSFDGVETRHLKVTLTKDERNVYNAAAEAWGRLWDAFQFCAKECNVPIGNKDVLRELREHGLRGKVPYSELNGQFESNRKAAMATLIAAFKARAVIVDAKEQLDQGRAFVIQMQNTYESQLDRALGRAEDPSQIRLEPAELVSFAEALPIISFEVVEDGQDDKGKPINIFRPKKDAAGNPEINQVALATRNRLIAEMKAIKLPLPPLDQIMLAFGPARLAEVTGRSKRLIPDKPNGDRDGATGVLLEERTEAQRLEDIDAFHAGQKMGLVFSTGAGGSSLSYHARAGSRNQARRVHYVIQLGYRADEVTQGFGRTHRSDQVEPPILTLVSCDMPADQLYASRIVSALFKMGALTQGHRHAQSNGMFDESDCLDGPYAEGAWEDLQRDLQDNLIAGYSWEQFMRDLGLGTNGEEEYERWGKKKTRVVLTNVNRLINRVAALTDRRQDIIFDELKHRINLRIEKAIAEGTFNAGPETLKATSLKIVSEKLIDQDKVHGAQTRLLRIRKTSELATISFGEAYKVYRRSRAGSSGYANFCTHRTTGAVALIAKGPPVYDPLGRQLPTREIITPTSRTTKLARVVDREPWHPAADMNKFEAMWNAAVEAAPAESMSYVTLVSDALLPIWTALNRAAGYRTAVYRLQTDDGEQIVGRPLAPEFLRDFLTKVEAETAPDDAELDEIAAHLAKRNRVALGSTGKVPHMLSGVFTGSKMTGLQLELGETASTILSVALDSLPGVAGGRGGGATITLAHRPKEIGHALRAVLSCCPALHIEEDAATVAAKLAALQAQQPAATSPAIQPVAATASSVAVQPALAAQAMQKAA